MRELRRSKFCGLGTWGRAGGIVYRETVSGEEKLDGTNGDPDPNKTREERRITNQTR